MDNNNTPRLAPVVPLIVHGNVAHYRYLALRADVDTLRVLVLVMARELEDARAAGTVVAAEDSRGG